MSGVWLCEPEPGVKRLARAYALLGGRTGPAETCASVRRELRALRRAAIANLEAIEREACAAWSGAGLRVHVARTAAEAVEIVRGIAGTTKYAAVNRSAAAAKELAPALRGAGFAVTDTYYLNLAQASPQQRSFWQLPELGGADVLGCFARPRQLLEARRDLFAARDVVGILGVAAAAADGSFYLLQHFQNAAEMFAAARQVVLLVGLEKLVPTAADGLLQTRATALFGAEATLLDLAPVASPGVPIESLPSVVPGDGLHVILLDNGRRALLGGPYHDLLACVGCRACAVKCPTYREYGGPERWSPRDYLFFHLIGRAPYPAPPRGGQGRPPTRGDRPVELCVGCTMCLAQCPVGIDLPAMMQLAKGARAADIGARLLGNFEGAARVAERVPRLANATLANPRMRRVAQSALGIAAERRLPRFAGETFAAWFSRRAIRQRAGRVAYFAGCMANYVTPEIAKASVALLERAGLEVCYPQQVCCGIPQLGNGLTSSARAHAHRNVASLLAADCDVVTACTSCALALKRDYQHVLDIPGATRLAARTYDVMEYFGRLLGDGKLPPPAQEQALTVLYHAPCHLRSRGDELVEGRVALLARVPGISAKLIDRGCCGMAGTFGSKSRGYALSLDIGAPLFEAIREARPDAVATDCPTCSMQLEHGTGRTPVHPAVLLARAYGAEGGENG